MNVRERVFFICGPDSFGHQRALESIKKRILRDRPASLNVLTLYAKSLDLKTLSCRLLNTSFDKEKIIIFKGFHDFSSEARKVIVANLKKIIPGNYLIFETDKDYHELRKNKRFMSDKLFNFILSRAAGFQAAQKRRPASLVDFADSVKRKDLKKALYILEELFESGVNSKTLGPQILGFLVNRCSYLPASGRKEICFDYLWEADRAIKEKGLNGRLVIETLLAKLLLQ